MTKIRKKYVFLIHSFVTKSGNCSGIIRILVFIGVVYMNKNILIADDNSSIIEILKVYVTKEGYNPIIANDGVEALKKFEEFSPIILLLDIMMPKKSGIEVCQEIRKTSNIPIIIITAKGEDSDRIMGLDVGADDYIVKPFSPAEVMARIRAVLRRIEIPEDEKKNVLLFPDLEIDISTYQVKVSKTDINLTKKEIEILWLLASNPGKVFSRDNILNSIWGYEYFGDARTVDTHIKRLRAKLSMNDNNKWDIKTIWGVGYKFEVKDV